MKKFAPPCAVDIDWDLSVDEVEAGVFAEAFGDDDSCGGLVVFEDGCYDSGQSEGRAVEGVAEASFFVFGAVAAFETVGLVGLEV